MPTPQLLHHGMTRELSGKTPSTAVRPVVTTPPGTRSAPSRHAVPPALNGRAPAVAVGRAAPKVPPPYRPPAQPVAAQRSPANVPRASIAHAHPPPSPQGRLKAAAAAAIQRYEVLPPARIHQHAPDWSFSLEYPYAVVGNAPFNAQAKAVGVGGVNKFL